jgi:WXXGXW repeat (2 copies)
MRVARLLCLFMLAAMILALPSATPAQIVGVSITIAPPILPVYTQPVCPAAGYLWTPGYWAYGPDGYYWVPGTWVEPPEVGFLWTPGYWAWNNGVYAWNEGYWGPQIGFYGGVVYGFGYDGVGFEGGYWRGGNFFYNRAVMNVNTTVIHNIYTKNVVIRNETHVSFNGGNGGIQARPTAKQEAYAHEAHRPPTSMQIQQAHAAGSNRELLYSANHGRPPIAATPKPGEFTGKGVVAARNAPAPKGETRPVSARTPKPASAERTESRPAPKAESRPAPKTESRPMAKTESRPAPKAESRPAPKTESKPATKTENRPAPKTESRPAPKTESRPMEKTESRPARKAESRPAPKAESKPAPRAESKPEPKAESRPAPKTESKPAGGHAESRPAEQPKEEHPHR